MKKIVFLVIIVLLTFIIYKFSQNNRKYYFSIKDNNYEYSSLIKKNISELKKITVYEQEDIGITELIRNIKNNIKVDDKNIQNILVKADIITIDIGNNELDYQIKKDDINNLYYYIDKTLKRIEKLLKLIRIYSKEKIYVIGFYTESEYYSELIKYLNIKVEDICKKYSIVFIKRKGINDSVNISKKIAKSYCKN